VAEALHLGRSAPMSTAIRRLDLGKMHALRRSAEPRVSWTALMVRAMGLVSARRPELRQIYRRFPWPHIYQHDQSVAIVPIQREYGGREWLFFARIRTPEEKPLMLLRGVLGHFRDTPVEEIEELRWLRRLAWAPWPARRLLMWAGYHGPSLFRVRHFGTFAVSSLGHLGALGLQPPGVVPAVISCGPVDDEGRCDVALTFDHRLYDGALAVRVLGELEETLNGRLADELRASASASAMPTVSK